MAIQMIQNTSSGICATDHFLNSLHWIEEMEYREPPSPVFKVPSDPPEDLVFNYNLYYNLYYYSSIWMYYPIPNRYSQKHTPPKNIKIKNTNQHLRKMGRLKQPGGSSCNQRR